MSYTIRATIADLQNSAGVIDENAQTVKSEVAAVTNLINELRSTFLGQRAGNFFKTFDGDLEAMNNWYNTVEAFAGELRSAASNLNAADTV